MKKLTVLCIVTALLLTMTACGGNSTGGDESSESASESSSQPAEESAPAAASVPAPAEEDVTLPDDVKLDETGESLIPEGAERVAITNGNLTLQSGADLETLAAFYTAAAENLGGAGEIVTTGEGEDAPVWKWVGTYATSKTLEVSVYPFDEQTFTMIVLY